MPATHCTGLSDPAAQYEPAGQIVQLDASEPNVPERHGEHIVAPGTLYLPASHDIQLSTLIAPSDELNLPASHNVQLAAPAKLYLPALHSEQIDAPVEPL